VEVVSAATDGIGLLVVIVILELADFFVTLQTARQESETRGVMLELLLKLTKREVEEREYIEH
jgi:hypothetical protein